MQNKLLVVYNMQNMMITPKQKPIVSYCFILHISDPLTSKHNRQCIRYKPKLGLQITFVAFPSFINPNYCIKMHNENFSLMYKAKDDHALVVVKSHLFSTKQENNIQYENNQ